MPAIMPVEIAQQRPHSIGRRIDDRRTNDADHLTSELALESIKAALKNAASDRRDELDLALRVAVEFRGPLGKSPIAVGDWGETQSCHVILDPHGRFENRIGAKEIEVRKAEKLFPDAIAVAQAEIAHAADLVRRFAVLDSALGDSGVPGGQTVEIAHPRPDAVR